MLLVALTARLVVLPASHEGNMSPDAAHFLNVARCVERGQGYSNPAAWPAWLSPERLPGPETFKDPGYPYAIAALTPLTRDPFRAGQLLSLLAGVLLPLAVYALGHRVMRDPAVALLAALFAAASPVLIAQSVRVMAESLFTLLLTLAFAAAVPAAGEAYGPSPSPGAGAAAGEVHGPSPSPGAGAAPRPARALAAGALLGGAFLVRSQALLALPAFFLLLQGDAPRRGALARAGFAALAMAVVAAPRLLRDLLLFGVPLHSDAAAFAVWPFVDPLEFSHRLTRPPSPLPFLLGHLSQVVAHTGESLARFLRGTLPREILGHLIWAPALAAGMVLGLARWRTWGFAWAYLVPAVLVMSAVSWNTRYFASTAPLWCLLAAAGAMWLLRRVPAHRWPLALRVLAAAAVLGLAALQTRRAWREVHGYAPPEIAAAIAEGAILASRLAPGESVMAVTTSYWSWFSDRPSVHWVIADSADFRAVIHRYRVRWAALPTSRLAEFAARYPAGRLPAVLALDNTDLARDVTVFEVRDTPPHAESFRPGVRPTGRSKTPRGGA